MDQRHRSYASFSLLLFAVDVAILTAMTVINPPIYTRTTLTYDQFGRSASSYGHCTYIEQRGYTISLAVLNVGLLLMSIYQSYLARNLSTEFAESEYIAKALFIDMLVLFVGIPVLALSYESPNALVFLGSSLITAVCMTVLLFIFVPKWQYRQQESKGKKVKVSGFEGEAVHPAGINYISATDDDDRRDSDSGAIGERILTKKTAAELAVLVHDLEKQLQKAQENGSANETQPLVSAKEIEPITSIGGDEKAAESESNGE